MLVYVKLFPGIFSENKVTAIVSTPVKLDTSNLNKLSVSFATRPEATNTDADELKLSDTRLAIPCIMHLSDVWLLGCVIMANGRECQIFTWSIVEDEATREYVAVKDGNVK